MEPLAAAIEHEVEDQLENTAEIIPILPILSLGTVRLDVVPYGVVLVSNTSVFIRYPTSDMVDDGQIVEYGLHKDEETRKATFYLKLNDVWTKIKWSILDE